MNEQLKQLKKISQPALDFLQRHLALIAVIIFLLIATAMFVRINQLSSATPTQSQIDTQAQSITQPKIAPALLDKIQQLQNNNIQVQTLFEQARNNPFSE